MPQDPERVFDIPDPEKLESATAVMYPKHDNPGSKVDEVLEKHTDSLSAMEGVVMVGHGQDELGQDCITVGVKTSAAVARIPKMIEGVRVCVEVIGEVDAL